MGNLAGTYRNQGRWKEAEELKVQVMETTKRVLGTEHPSTLTSMGNLAETYKAQGRDAEAISLLRECVRLQRWVLGRPCGTKMGTLMRGFFRFGGTRILGST
ncbi:hypothetical protein P152DRAFT_386954 [Eremomyces bilateralis CBS 781.70]|uniref:TPR-like protein n=1 Tax=Eremomyces bilateralis CBS 781.70 TaxID=1392243 RepID=A0A6G1GG24_9PEZI|nr:uncharacterized protein P152DRAFT_386954 [Eremomyces bilateralis CBS 781.70]KAF1816974.1 hypothetical protein P152DRAFT_386954 [Eremomyces bilateralis CBS 781.70]